MSEPVPGQLYHTVDGKTVYIDPKTKQISVFEGILTLDSIQKPTSPAIQPGSGSSNLPDAIDSIMKSLLPMLPGVAAITGSKQLDFIVTAIPASQAAKENNQPEAPILIAGEKSYFVLTPAKTMPLSVQPCRIPAWVSELESSPEEYEGYKKTAIMPEQMEWLAEHKTCSIIGWLDGKCPVFATLACQKHNKIIRPICKIENAVDSTNINNKVNIEIADIAFDLEAISSEERDV